MTRKVIPQSFDMTLHNTPMNWTKQLLGVLFAMLSKLISKMNIVALSSEITNALVENVLVNRVEIVPQIANYDLLNHCSTSHCISISELGYQQQFG